MIDLLPADSIVIRPLTMHQMASLCYEIGNKHLPLFVDEDDVLVPYEEPLFRWLTAGGFNPHRQIRKLLNPLKTTTMAHAHVAGSNSLFSKIMQLTKNHTGE
jgi:urease accessory protein